MKPERTAHRYRRRSLGPVPFFLLAACLALCVAGVASGTGQSDEKPEREIEDRIPAHLPIKFKVKNAEKAKDLKNEDWLRDIEIEVKNTGTKPIYFLRFGLFFIDVESRPGKTYGIPLAYGRPEMIAIEERAKPEDVPIMPGETHVFRVSESSARGWKYHKTRESKPHPKKIGLRFYELNFGDGTGFLTTGGVPYPGRTSSTVRKGAPHAS